MNFLSNMFSGGNTAAQSETTSISTTSNVLSLLGSSSDILLSDGTKQVGGTPTTVGQVIGGDVKLLMLYFSMHNCPPCREFTPLLVELYNEHNENEKVIEVVFCSGDQD